MKSTNYVGKKLLCFLSDTEGRFTFAGFTPNRQNYRLLLKKDNHECHNVNGEQLVSKQDKMYNGSTIPEFWLA